MTWISVKDRIPACAGYYLVWTIHEDDPTDQCARYTCYFNVSKNWEIANVEDVEVTHWMELPKGPQDV